MVVRWVAGALVPLALAMGSADGLAAESYQSQAGSISVVTVAEGLEQPWGLAFLPDGRMLVTEKEGRLRVVAPDGTLSEPLAGVPEVYDNGQGGLLDVALDPDFAVNQLVYLSFAEPGGEGGGTAVARGKLGAGRLDHVEVIWRQQPKLDGGQHFGSRLVFLKDGTLIVTLGDRNQRQYIPDMKAQIGKLVRINRDGSIPKDNPWLSRATVLPDTFAHGFKDPEGAALHPQTGELWMIDHGPQGGDEINIIRAGKDYGWPDVSYGRQYDARQLDGRKNVRVGDGATSRPDVEEPIYYWVPSIAPSGMMFYTGDMFPEWKGNLFIGAMAGQHLVRLVLNGERVAAEEQLLAEQKQRVREVRQAPDGSIYILQGASIVRLTPKK
jgi:aldose sugar dehydrogenase